MTVTEDFAAAYRRSAAWSPDLEMVPTRLAIAVTEATGADGVGLGVFGTPGFPVPIGASCDRTVLAERLKFTVGQGPCHDAHRSGRTVVATEPVMAASWPIYYDLLVTQTLFRSVVALPLAGPFSAMATIDLLFHDPDAAAHAGLAEIAVLCRHITAALIEADLMAVDLATGPTAVGHQEGPVWLAGPSGRARNLVMVAAGMLTNHLGVSAADALKVLKAHAYANHRTTDDVAAAVVTGDSPSTTFDLDF